jgi:predicted metal-binding protein
MEQRSSGTDRPAQLMEAARRLGASDVVVFPASVIVVKDELAALCRDPGCESYGKSAGCPPYVSGPGGFKKRLETTDRALFFKIDVPFECMLTDERRDLFILLHEITAGLERAAVAAGYAGSEGFAGGGCKALFCRSHPDCRAIAAGECRNPDRARPSMSGYGVDVSYLMKQAGWSMSWRSEGSTSMGTLCGLVLLR